jgi:hypothetical protein
VDDPTVTGNARAMSPDDVQREDEEEGNSELGGTARGVVVAEGAEREDVGADVAGEGAANAQEPYHRYEQSHRSCCC